MSTSTDAFERGSIAPLPLGSVAGQAIFSGCLAIVRLPVDVVRSMLPPELTLRETNADTYPCLLAFGEHHDAKAFFGGVPVTWGAQYRELMVAVPFVGRGATAHLFVVGMACDAWWAVWNGNVHYGFRKRLASIGWDGTRYRVGDEHREHCFDATVQPNRHDSEKLTWIRLASSLPVLGHRSDGRFVESRFEWDFAAAVVEPVEAEVTLGNQFGAISSAALRCSEAYNVRRMRWRLSWPTALPTA